MKYLTELIVAHVAASGNEMQELARHLNPTAVGEVVLLLDMDGLDSYMEDCTVMSRGPAPVVQNLIATLPPNFDGLIYITR